MADRIVSVQTVTANTTAGVIELPPIKGAQPNAYGAVSNQGDAVTYIFDGSNSVDVELVQESTDTAGIKIPASTAYTSGPWRLAGGPPKYLYAGSSTTIRVTVVLER